MKKKAKILFLVSGVMMIAGFAAMNLYYSGLAPTSLAEPETKRIATHPEEYSVTGSEIIHVKKAEAEGPERPITKESTATDTAGRNESENPVPESVDREMLRNQFPDKAYLLPVTREEVAERKQAIRETVETLKRILAGKASEEDIHSYYDVKLKAANDRIDIIEFIISTYGESLGEDELYRNETTLVTLQEQRNKIPERRQHALMRLKNQKG